jgi:hypothetical protein
LTVVLLLLLQLVSSGIATAAASATTVISVTTAGMCKHFEEVPLPSYQLFLHTAAIDCVHNFKQLQNAVCFERSSAAASTYI